MQPSESAGMAFIHPLDCGQHQESLPSGCLGSTCMHWLASGELSELDRLQILDRLALVDPNLARQQCSTKASRY